MDPVTEIRDELAGMPEDVMLVGHFPFLGKLVFLLLTSSETNASITFQEGGIVCLERTDAGGWQIVWSVTPDLAD